MSVEEPRKKAGALYVAAQKAAELGYSTTSEAAHGDVARALQKLAWAAMVRHAEALVESILRGDPVEDRHDATVARARLLEIEAHPKRLISGEELQRRLDELSS